MPKDIFDLTGKVAFVTGAGRGAGRGIATVLAEHGANIALASRTEADLKKTADAVQKLGRRALILPVDVTSHDQVKQAIQRTVREMGGLDILVNNAGGSRYVGSFKSSTPEHWKADVDLNLWGVVYTCYEAGKVMMERGGGKIVNVGASSALHGGPAVLIYTAAKGGVNALTRSLAMEWAQYGIYVNCVAPGPIATENSYQNYMRNVNPTGEGYYDAKGNAVARTNLTRRRATPEEIGYAVLFMASRASDMVQGQVLYVDGGLNACQVTNWENILKK